MKLFYATTGIGGCIRDAKDITEARAKIIREVGEFNGIQELREATKADIAWVRAMGGFVPKLKETFND